MSRVFALISKWNSEKTIAGIYQDLIISSADSGSKKMEGYLDSLGADPTFGGMDMQEGEASSQGSTLIFKVGTAEFNLKAVDRTFNRLYGDVTLDDGSVSPCAFKKFHA